LGAIAGRLAARHGRVRGGGTLAEAAALLHLPIRELTLIPDVLAVRVPMLYWALVFLIIAIVAGALGFGGLAATAGSIAHILFVVFLVFFLVALIGGLMARRGPPVY
jgi:uncharacterized membrane protein YtjA (UPF0391 family)